MAPAQAFGHFTSVCHRPIGPTAVEEKTKADCRTRKGSKQRTRAAQRPFLIFTKTRT